MQKLNIKIIAVTIICLLLVACASNAGEKYITGEEWLFKQADCLEEVEIFADGISDVYSLYIAGKITDEDFRNELQVLEEQRKILVQNYAKLKEANPVKEDSHTYFSLRGTEGVEKCYDILDDVVFCAVTEDGNLYESEETAYRFLAFKRELRDYIAEYTAAMIWYYDAATTPTE